MGSATKVFSLISSEHLQYIVYLILSLAVTVCTGALFSRNKVIYQPFIGRINPVAVMAAVAVLGFILLTYLLARGWFAIFQRQNGRGIVLAAALAAFFAAVMILVDIWIVMPPDINRPYPDSLLFYPTIGFAVEILFHVLPLTILLILTTSLFKHLTLEQVIWPCIFLVALLEPLFQTWWGFSRPYPWWTMALIALTIFFINLAQLALFKRYDFVTMYSLRLVYYLLWHIVWGIIRLRVLF